MIGIVLYGRISKSDVSIVTGAAPFVDSSKIPRNATSVLARVWILCLYGVQVESVPWLRLMSAMFEEGKNNISRSSHQS